MQNIGLEFGVAAISKRAGDALGRQQFDKSNED